MRETLIKKTAGINMAKYCLSGKSIPSNRSAMQKNGKAGNISKSLAEREPGL
jgi:hypothetical protein